MKQLKAKTFYSLKGKKMSKKLDEYLRREQASELLKSELQKVFSSIDLSKLKDEAITQEQIPFEFSSAHSQILTQALEFEKEGKFKDALTLFNELAEHNSRIGLEKAGEYYLFAKGTSRDENKAYQYFLKGKKAGSPKSHYYVGYCKFNGIGTLKDPNAGLLDIENAAFLDSTEAMEYLVEIFEKGIFVEQDFEVGNFWREKLGEDVGSA